MKKSAFALLLLATTSQGLCQENSREFLCWYDGWGNHNVWGAGIVSGSYMNAYVQCGSARIPVRAIHDSHETDGNPLPPTQTAEHAISVNEPLLRAIEAAGDKCSFKQAPGAGA